MINSITLQNFKCFSQAHFPISTLNVLTGMNGAGKSTVIQSLLVIRQSWESGSISKNRLQLNGDFVELGTAKEVFCAEPNSSKIGLELASSKIAKPLNFISEVSLTASNEYVLPFETNASIELLDYEIFANPFCYLHAERIGPRKSYDVPFSDYGTSRVEKLSENVPFLIKSNSANLLIWNRWLLVPSSDDKIYPTFRFQFSSWMDRLFPGFQSNYLEHTIADQIHLELALQTKQTGQKLFVRPTNTGFGVSYALGVIVAGLIADDGSILIVENPEAHLHPKAQSTIGEFLARVAAGGVQVFVETHSEHVMNGIRRVVKTEILNSNDVSVHYFGKSTDQMEPKIERVNISQSGEIASWPEGFFDQLDRDLTDILF